MLVIFMVSMTYFLAFLAALLGSTLGFALGAGIASALAPMLGISSFEGASGYFAVFVGGPIGAFLGLVLGAVLVLRRSGHRNFSAIIGRLALIVVGVLGTGSAVLGVFWLMRPVINTNGPAPQLVFEIRLPPGAVLQGERSATVELQTSKNRMPGSLGGSRQEQGRTVLTGSVEMYYRTWRRTLVLTMPDKTDVLFSIQLGLTPLNSNAFGSWEQASYIVEPGQQEARHTTAGEPYEIRYRADWPGED